MKKNKVFITILILVLCVGTIHSARFFFGPRGKVTFDQRILNRSKGSPKAPAWIVEYMDYQCPACRKAFYILEVVQKRYPSQIYFQVRFHPLRQHVHGLESAIYSECAAHQKKFWEFHRLLFEDQKKWEKLPDVNQPFHDYARRAGLNLQALDSCVADPLTPETILKENTESVTLGVSQTPTFFVNGKLVAGLELMKEELKQLFPDFNLTTDMEGENSN